MTKRWDGFNMITIENKLIQQIPTLIVENSLYKGKPLPIVMYMHGITSAKEHNLPIAYLLALQGYRVLLCDSKHHGERDEGLSQQEVEFEFWQIVEQNIKEIRIIKEEMEREGLLLDGRFGLAGTSMGGISTSGAFAVYPWIKVGAVLMGSPKLMDMARFTIHQVTEKGVTLPFTNDQLEEQIHKLFPIDLSQHMDKLNNRPLFFWHGDQDLTVPFEHAYSFYEAAKQKYRDPSRIHFIREQGRGHKVSRKAILEAVNWFVKYL
jgi:uncharacterized protein